MKPWETREWWESRKWTNKEIEELCKEEYERLEKQPWFERGKPCKSDIYMERDIYEELYATWGRRFGAEGIGKLREVFLCRPHEYEINPMFAKEPAYYRLYGREMPDLDQWQKDFDEYVKILEGEGVKVNLLPPPETPIGPYGFLRNLTAVGIHVTKAGLIEIRSALSGYSARTMWRTKELMKLDVPVLYMLHGKEVGEHTPIYLGENSCVIADGYAANTEGCQAYKSVLESIGTEVWIAHTPGYLDMWGFPAGGCSHIDMVLGVVDLGLALVYPSFVGYSTIRYLKSRKIRLIEVPPEDYVNYGCNVVILEPGKVLIPAAAKQTITQLKAEGITCVEVDFANNGMAGTGGPDCITGKLLRDPGPSLDDL